MPYMYHDCRTILKCVWAMEKSNKISNNLDCCFFNHQNNHLSKFLFQFTRFPLVNVPIPDAKEGPISTGYHLYVGGLQTKVEPWVPLSQWTHQVRLSFPFQFYLWYTYYTDSTVLAMSKKLDKNTKEIIWISHRESWMKSGKSRSTVWRVPRRTFQTGKRIECKSIEPSLKQINRRKNTRLGVADCDLHLSNAYTQPTFAIPPPPSSAFLRTARCADSLRAENAKKLLRHSTIYTIAIIASFSSNSYILHEKLSTAYTRPDLKPTLLRSVHCPVVSGGTRGLQKIEKRIWKSCGSSWK